MRHLPNQTARQLRGFYRALLISIVLGLISLGLSTVGFAGASIASASSPSSPIMLVVDSASPNPFGPYMGEILRAEGINSFQIQQLSTLTSSSLTGTPIVILTQTATLNSSEVAMFTSYVSGGGILIAMRPDTQLAPIFGLTPTGTTTSEGYIQIQGGSPAAAGLPTETMQFHGTADDYVLNGASVTALLYTNATTPTPYPAVVTHPYGTGYGVAFTYDLAQSVAYTRQGNPATAGTDVDGDDGVPRTIEAFINWVDLTRVPIPQADEQQRLLSNLITYYDSQTTPLPRLWYFPSISQKSIIVLTGDDHGQPTSTFQQMVNVAEQYGARQSFYLSRWGNLSAASEQAWWNQGFEFGYHPYAMADNETVAQGFATALGWFTGQGYLGPSNTERMHQLNWQGWADAAKVMQQYGITMDESFYTWGAWLQQPNGQWDCTGYVTGSGLPMKFVDQSGNIIPVYQQATQLVDEQMIAGTDTGGAYCDLSGPQAVAPSEQLIQQSMNGYYSAVTVQAHTDYYLNATFPWYQGLLAWAQSMNVPVWTASRWASFTQARHDATISSVSWANGTGQLSFQVSSSVTEPTLTILVPATYQSSPIGAITVDGANTANVPAQITGLNYASIAVPTGTHTVSVTYNLSTRVTATPTDTSTPTATSTPMATATVSPSYVLFSDGFEESNFSNGPWTLDVTGTGSTAQLVTSPVYDGKQAGKFTIQTDANGEHAFADGRFTWPSSKIVDASVYLQPQAPSIVEDTKVFSLETLGPNAYGPRAAFSLRSKTFGVIYTTRDGALHYADTGVGYTSGQWYQLGLSVDYRGTNPALTWTIGGQVIYQVLDTTTGTDQDTPVELTVGIGPGAYGANAGSVIIDDAMVWDGSYLGGPTPTSTGTVTPTSTATATSTATSTPCSGPCPATATPTPQPTAIDALTPTMTGTVTPCGNCTATPTASSTPSPTLTATPTSCSPSCTATPTPTFTRTPTLTPTPNPVIFSDGFEEGSFTAGGWTTNVSGTGSSAQIVATPSFAGKAAGQFVTTSQTSGQQAIATASFAWPSSQVATAQGEVYLQGMAIQEISKLFSLETQGPNAYGPRVAFGVGPSTWYAIYTTKDGTVHYDNTGWTYQANSWYSLSATVDYRGSNPVLTWAIGGQQIYQIVDTTSGADLDQPVALTIGMTPGWWGANAGTATFDQISVTATGPSLSPTPTATASATPTGTLAPSTTATATSAATLTPTGTLTATSTGTVTATATPPVSGSLTDTSVTDFKACGVTAGVEVSDEAGGEVRLAAAFEDYFGEDSAISAGQWAWGSWDGSNSFSPVPSGGSLAVQSSTGSAWLRSQGSYTQQALSGEVSFGAGPWEHFGWATSGFSGPYAIVSTYNGSTSLYARTYDGTSETRTLLSGVSLNASHLVQIVWGPSSVAYYVDGALVATHNVAISVPMYVYLSNNSTQGTLQAQWTRVESYPQTSATWVSCAKDGGAAGTTWGTVSLAEQVPSGTGVGVQTRTSADGASWSAWVPTGAGGQVASPAGRYLQYELTLSGTPTTSPEVDAVTLSVATPTATPTP